MAAGWRRYASIGMTEVAQVLREIRRFTVRSETGATFEMVEVMAFHPGRPGRMDSGPTYFLANGYQAIPERRFGEYRVPRLGIVVRDFRQRRAAAPAECNGDSGPPHSP